MWTHLRITRFYLTALSILGYLRYPQRECWKQSVYATGVRRSWSTVRSGPKFFCAIVMNEYGAVWITAVAGRYAKTRWVRPFAFVVDLSALQRTECWMNRVVSANKISVCIALDFFVGPSLRFTITRPLVELNRCVSNYRN